MFYIGGTKDEYEAFTCDWTMDSSCEEDDPSESFNNIGASQAAAIPTASNTMNFADPLIYSGYDLMLKIQNYVPPMKEELQT